MCFKMVEYFKNLDNTLQLSERCRGIEQVQEAKGKKYPFLFLIEND